MPKDKRNASNKRKEELKVEILKTLTNVNSLLSEIAIHIESLRNETKPGGRLDVGEDKVWESFQPVLDSFGGPVV